MNTLKITQDNFEEVVLKSEIPVLLDFWAPWCGPCKTVGPILDDVAKETAGKAKIGKVNVDEEPDLAQKFRVMSIPTLVVMDKGTVISNQVGVKSKQVILDMLP